MGDSTSQQALPPPPTESWLAFQVALNRLLADFVRDQLAASPEARSAGAEGRRAAAQPPTVPDIRKMITEVLSTVLLETKILEKAIEKQLKSSGRAEADADSAEAVRQETVKAVRDFLTKNLGMIFQTEIRGAIQKEIRAFLNSEELKEMLDEKFRTINTYLTTEVIPRVVQQELEKTA